MTTESAIPDLLLERVTTLILNPVLPVAHPGRSFTRPTGPFLEVRHLPNSNVNLFVQNDAPVQYRGLLQVTVDYPPDLGIIKPNEIAGQIVAHFAKGTILRGNGISVQVYQKPSVAASMQDDDRVRIPVTIPYQCFAT